MPKIMAVLLVLVIMSGVLLAQSLSDNDEIPACTQAEAIEFVKAIKDTEIFDLISTLIRRTNGDKKGDFGWSVDSAIMLRRLYERDIVPFLPDCALIIRWRLRFESMLNGLGLSYSALAIYEADIAPESLESRMPALLESINSATSEVTELSNELIALAEEDDE